LGFEFDFFFVITVMTAAILISRATQSIK